MITTYRLFHLNFKVPHSGAVHSELAKGKCLISETKNLHWNWIQLDSWDLCTAKKKFKTYTSVLLSPTQLTRKRPSALEVSRSSLQQILHLDLKLLFFKVSNCSETQFYWSWISSYILSKGNVSHLTWNCTSFDDMKTFC